MKYLTQIKLVAFDVDGVLTDGVIYYGPQGDFIKGFSAHDGMGVSLAHIGGLKTALITGRKTPMVEKRANDLHIDYVVQDAKDKLSEMRKLCDQIGIKLEEVSYMGDDLNDAELVGHVGFGASPLDGCEEVRREAAFVSAFKGGHGAVRELVEYILKGQNKWNYVLQQFKGSNDNVEQ